MIERDSTSIPTLAFLPLPSLFVICLCLEYADHSSGPPFLLFPSTAQMLMVFVWVLCLRHELCMCTTSMNASARIIFRSSSISDHMTLLFASSLSLLFSTRIVSLQTHERRKANKTRTFETSRNPAVLGTHSHLYKYRQTQRHAESRRERERERVPFGELFASFQQCSLCIGLCSLMTGCVCKMLPLV